jgi:hypothetical protein
MLTTVDKHREVDLHSMFQQPTAWFVQREIQRYPYPLSSHSNACGTTGSSYQKILSSDNSGVEWTLGLSSGVIQQLVDDYFISFNIIYPVLDWDVFVQNALPSLSALESGEDATASIIALLVLALGTVVHEGVFGTPTTSGSGIRGGHASSPPGVELFDEARRRSGLVFNQIGLPNVQILLLMAYVNNSEFCHRQ